MPFEPSDTTFADRHGRTWRVVLTLGREQAIRSRGRRLRPNPRKAGPMNPNEMVPEGAAGPAVARARRILSDIARINAAHAAASVGPKARPPRPAAASDPRPSRNRPPLTEPQAHVP